MNWNEWIGKKVCIELKKDKFFGTIIEIQEYSSGLIFITIEDRNSKHQIFSAGEIARIEELR